MTVCAETTKRDEGVLARAAVPPAMGDVTLEPCVNVDDTAGQMAFQRKLGHLEVPI
jgi:hypothetical protein